MESFISLADALDDLLGLADLLGWRHLLGAAAALGLLLVLVRSHLPLLLAVLAFAAAWLVLELIFNALRLGLARLAPSQHWSSTQPAGSDRARASPPLRAV